MRSSTFKFPALVFLLLLAIWTQGQDTGIKKDFSGVRQLEMTVDNGDLKVSRSPDNEVHIRLKVEVEARSEENARQIRERFQLKTAQDGSRLRAASDFGITYWTNRNGNITLTFKDGTKIRDIQKLEVDYTLLVPDLEKMTLSNKYNDIEITQNLTTDLTVELYDGKLNAQAIDGHFALVNKYGEASLKSTRSATLEIYDAEVELGNSGSVKLISKYSEIEMGSCTDLDLKSYDDDISVQNISGALVVEDKYSDLDFGDFQTARFDLYDTDFRIGSGNTVDISSKYSDLRLGILQTLRFTSSYDDEIAITELQNLDLNSKYSELDVVRVRNGLKIISYDDEIDIDRFEGDMESIYFEGKYTELDLNLASSLQYRIEATMTYGNLKFDESEYDISLYKGKDDKIELKAKTKGASAQSPLVELVAYDCNIRL